MQSDPTKWVSKLSFEEVGRRRVLTKTPVALLIPETASCSNELADETSPRIRSRMPFKVALTASEIWTG